MPGGNRTGPYGEGPRTGRGMGYCSGSDTPGYTKGAGMGSGIGAGRAFGAGSFAQFGRGFRSARAFGPGRAFGCGRGRGFGSFWGFGPENLWASPESEVEYLESRVNSLKQELTTLTKRLNEVRSPRLPNKE